jgi:hypothetical protein
MIGEFSILDAISSLISSPDLTSSSPFADDKHGEQIHDQEYGHIMILPHLPDSSMLSSLIRAMFRNPDQ